MTGTTADIIERAKTYAIERHAFVNHTYDGQPYDVHLGMVDLFAEKYAHLLPEEDRPVARAGAWGHDLIEDTRETFNDVRNKLGERTAEVVFALTNDKGKTRSERAGPNYYLGLREDPIAHFIKICDRMANATYSKQKGSRMFEMYKKEHPKFVQNLHSVNFHEMFEELEQIFFGE